MNKSGRKIQQKTEQVKERSENGTMLKDIRFRQFQSGRGLRIMNEAILRDAFEELKYGYAKEGLTSLYNDIYQEVCDASAETLANKITSKESKSVNNFYLQLDKEARRVAIDKMKEAGVQDENIPLIWTRIRRNIHSPEVKLCNQEGYSANVRNSERVTASSTVQRKIKKQKTEPHAIGKWIVIAGVAVEIVAWIFIPAYKTWSPIVKGIGIVLGVAGAAIIYKEKHTGPRITLTEAAVHQAKQQSKDYIKEICTKQCELNHRVFCEWLDQICEAVIKECKAELN